MSKPYDGDSAFPKPASPMDGTDYAQEGMSLRDWFAGQATDEDVAVYQRNRKRGLSNLDSRTTARYRHADAMLAEREKNAPE